MNDTKEILDLIQKQGDAYDGFTKRIDARFAGLEADIRETEERLKRLARKTPPEPVYDLLWYIIRKSPLPLESWQQDVLGVVRNQARALAPDRKTKILN